MNLEHMKEIIEEAISPRVSFEQNKTLKKIPSATEIKEALFSVHPEKAPGPDGFSACFFQSNWVVVGADMIKEVQEQQKEQQITDLLPCAMSITRQSLSCCPGAFSRSSKQSSQRPNLHLYQNEQYQLMFSLLTKFYTI